MGNRLGAAPPQGVERSRGGNRKAGVVAWQIDLGDEAIGRLDAGNAGQRRLLDQAVLQVAEGPLRAPPGPAAPLLASKRGKDHETRVVRPDGTGPHPRLL